MGGPMSMIYTLYDVLLHEELPFGVCADCTCVKIFSGINTILIIIIVIVIIIIIIIIIILDRD